MIIEIDIDCPNLKNMDESPDKLISIKNDYNMQYVKKVNVKKQDADQ
jgi:hypothetical protein